MNRPFATCLLFFVLALAGPTAVLSAAEIAVVTAPDAAPVERIVAGELAAALGKLYPKDRFAMTAEVPAVGRAIVVGVATRAAVRRHLGGEVPEVAESFVVRHVRFGGLELGIVAGADGRGTAYGVYALLTRLGCGFTLDRDTLPAPSATPFDFAGWSLADRPLVGERLVFNWHNFLSGCSTWNLADWQRWTVQSQKLGYNAIMVHAYGNNPMAGFTFEGQPRPVGYLSTTVKGRDWSTMHVNDVRRLFGGGVFDQPAFGSDAGLVPDDRRVPATQALMRAVFDHAAERKMGVYFAADVDTPSANPQELVLRLPESARFTVDGANATGTSTVGRIWVPNPDTPEGSAFYRAQVTEFVKAYPGITTLVAWFRRGRTPWMEAKLSDLPPAWQQEFSAEIARRPEVASYWHAPGLFAVGKIVRAFERALRELGAAHVRLASGTWGFEFLPAADRFFPPGVALIGLDYDVLHGKPQLGSEESRAPLREIGARRPVIPIMWAHHDDGQYLGRPYTPLPEFASKLADAKSAGFGIIHWTTRPLDLYFASLAQQVWQSTKDRPLHETCFDVAERWFGVENRASLGAYLDTWITGAPQFARETSDWFIDRKLTNIAEVVAGCRARLASLDSARTSALTPQQREQLDYWRGLEEFIAAAHETQGRLQESQEWLLKGDLAGARQAIGGCQPGPVIEQFARFSSSGGITRGEQGLVVTMNTRWYTHIVRQRQALGLESVRINFADTSHDMLAQSRGRFTFHFEPDRTVWECRGAQETGAEILTLPQTAKLERGGLAGPWEEIARTRLATAKPLTLTIGPIINVVSRAKEKRSTLAAGQYRVQLLFLDAESTAPAQRVFEVAIKPASSTESGVRESIDPFELAGGSHRFLVRSYPVTLDAPGLIELQLTPVRGKATLSGVIVEPVAVR